jgi:hypothetical protein
MIDPVVKTATSEPERGQLRHEAQVLLRARHPGVVVIAAFTDQDASTRLTIAGVDGCTLADAPPKQPLDALRFTAALARTIADLHAMGIAHRSLRADHVLCRADGRPLLCEFGDATTKAGDADRLGDAQALRNLVELIAAAIAPESHGSRAAGALRSLAADLRNEPLPAAPADVATRAGRAASRHAVRFRRRPRRRRPHRVTAFALGPAIVLGTVVLWSRRAGDVPSTSAPALISTSGATSVPIGRTPTRVDAGGAQFDVGQAGDQVLIADWHCDGEPSAALLRPSTGEVFVFAALPAAGETLTGRRVATVIDAVSIVDDRTDAACPPLAVRRADGTTFPIGDR